MTFDPALLGPMIALEGGTFAMGSNDPQGYPSDGEGPVHDVSVAAFSVAATAVTNAAWARFVTDTDYLTQAERDGWSFVFAGLLPDDFEPTQGVAAAPWWRKVDGADWRHPAGPQSSLDGRSDHPVVHVSWHDANAFCAWSGTRLLTEAEWEFAARGNLHQKRFPWGDEVVPADGHAANVWQGSFPDRNDVEDGWYDTAPVATFEPNGFGLYNMVGNAWEWCADWFDPATYRLETSAGSPRENPPGPSTGSYRVMRGGSYLCHESYCFRFRVAARSSNTPDSSTGNVGFRVAR